MTRGEKGLGRKALERTRSRLERVGSAGLAGLRRTGSRVAGAVGSAAERLRESPTGAKLGGAVELRRALRRAKDASARSDAPGAFAALEAEIGRHGDDPRLAAAFWDAAVACGREADAADPLLRAIRALASAGRLDAAADHWSDLVARLPARRADAATLLRLEPTLRARDEALARTALRHAVAEECEGLTPGLAVRVAERARECDPATALRAAEIALRAPGLHETRRARLHGLVVELGRAAVPAAAAAPAPDDVVGGLAPLHLAPPDLRQPAAPPAEPSLGLEDFSDLIGEIEEGS